MKKFFNSISGDGILGFLFFFGVAVVLAVLAAVLTNNPTGGNIRCRSLTNPTEEIYHGRFKDLYWFNESRVRVTDEQNHQLVIWNAQCTIVYDE